MTELGLLRPLALIVLIAAGAASDPSERIARVKQWLGEVPPVAESSTPAAAPSVTPPVVVEEPDPPPAPTGPPKPEPTPAVAPPKQDAAPVRPPRMAPAAKPKPRVKRHRDDAPKANSKAKVDDSGPDLPYSCATVRWAVSNFPRAYLEAEASKNGLTPKQRRQAQACLTGGKN